MKQKKATDQKNENISRSKRKKISKLFQKHIPLRKKQDWERMYAEKSPQDKNELKALLPTKIGTKLYQRFIQEEQEPALPIKTPKTKNSAQKTSEKISNLKNLSISEYSDNLTHVCTSVISNPAENIQKLEIFLKFLGEESLQEVEIEKGKCTVDSLFEVLMDLTPGYRYKSRENPSHLRLKKATWSAWSYEASYLMIYKEYVNMLMGCVSGGLAVCCLEYLCKLMVANPHFNYIDDIIHFVVRTLSTHNQRREIAEEWLARLLQEDQLGETSLKVVTVISGFSKSGSLFCKEMVSILFHVRIDEGVSLRALDTLKTIEDRVDRRNMSRKQRKDNREFRVLEKEMRHTEITENKERISQLQAQILQQIFYILFRILKKDNVEHGLLTQVLRGLSKFANFINIELIKDLLARLKEMLRQEDLSDPDRVTLVKTAFTITAGGDVTLLIEHNTFIQALYDSILSPGSEEDVLDCLQMIVSRSSEELSGDHVEAILCRVMVSCLSVSSEVVLRYLRIMGRLLMRSGMRSRVMGETVYSFSPECGSSLEGILWQCCVLKKHYSADVRDGVDELMGNGGCSGVDSFNESMDCEKPCVPSRGKWKGFMSPEFEGYYNQM